MFIYYIIVAVACVVFMKTTLLIAAFSPQRMQQGALSFFSFFLSLFFSLVLSSSWSSSSLSLTRLDNTKTASSMAATDNKTIDGQPSAT